MSSVETGLGVYFHIPYCLQRCTYCDFATYVHTEIKPPEYYVALVKKEISQRHNLFSGLKSTPLKTIYFGGGTPSLISAELIVDLISELSKFGYQTGPQTEITIEINPATVDERKLEIYLKAGINRFSVGAQSFSDRLLKMVHREHNAQQTKDTLALLRKYNLNFSFDVLFALPTQTLDELKYDVQVAVELGSKHISPYCLTVPEGHPLSKNRPLEDDQIEMFNIIHENLVKNNFSRYEISNYAQPGYESKHNLLYWTDENYWGFGLSAHSYMKNTGYSGNWGSRFWNASNFDLYDKDISAGKKVTGIHDLSENQKEMLRKYQSLTDFCHTALRLESGLNIQNIAEKFGFEASQKVQKIAADMTPHNVIELTKSGYRLTDSGVLVSNQIFEKFTFLEDDLKA
ncbi:MAG: radical SAM family heme chaperone HemW [Bdellovibrio sp.]|nr:radical SAM family heme chaperone HemW [Bdellovibrio sp.]